MNKNVSDKYIYIYIYIFFFFFLWEEIKIQREFLYILVILKISVYSKD